MNLIDLGFWITVVCVIIVTALSITAFIRWNKDLDTRESEMQMLRDTALFLDDLRREMGIELKDRNDPNKPEVTD